MPFLVVQTRKNRRSRPAMTVVPEPWVKNGLVYWPLSNLTRLARMEDSEPDMSWTPQKCKVVGRGASHTAAEATLKMLEVITDSEDAAELNRGTRNTPATKKPKFVSKTYHLAPSKKQSQIQLSSNSSGEYGHSSSTTSSKQIVLGSQRENPNESIVQLAASSATPVIDLPLSAITEASHLSLDAGSSANQNTLQPMIVQSGDNKQYLQLQNGTYLLLSDIIQGMSNIGGNKTGNNSKAPQVMHEVSEEVTSLQLDDFPDPLEELSVQPDLAEYPVVFQEPDAVPVEEKQIKSDEIERLERIEKKLDKILLFNADIDKYFKTKLNETREQDRKAKSNRSAEDFSEFEGLLPIKTLANLTALEAKLEVEGYSDKLLRYLEAMYSLNGKREGGPFFRNLIRQMIDVVVLLPFSWLGNTRAKSGEAPPVEQNKSFKKCFPILISFVAKVLRAADFEYTHEDTEKAFSEFLRHKHTEMKRHIKQNGQRRASHSRRRRQTNIPIDINIAAQAANENLDDQPETSDRSPDHTDFGSDSISENSED